MKGPKRKRPVFFLYCITNSELQTGPVPPAGNSSGVWGGPVTFLSSFSSLSTRWLKKNQCRRRTMTPPVPCLAYFTLTFFARFSPPRHVIQPPNWQSNYPNLGSFSSPPFGFLPYFILGHFFTGLGLTGFPCTPPPG